MTGSVQSETLSSYDLVGNPTGVNYGDHTGEGFLAGYNEWDQLTSHGALETYEYLAGIPGYNLGALQGKGGATYSYPAPGQPQVHAPTSVSGIGGFGYDPNGNRTSDASSTYAYDIENRLTQLAQGGTAVLQNSFDGDGVRVARVANGVTTHFVGDWYEANPATGVATAYYPFNGQPVAVKGGTTLSFLHRDHPGSLVSATDTSGNELRWARYYPFGAPLLAVPHRHSQTGANPQPLFCEVGAAVPAGACIHPVSMRWTTALVRPALPVGQAQGRSVAYDA